MSRVLVGMSGGVDSAVAAALLIEQGHDVTGAFMKNWTLDVPGSRCPWADDLASAKRTAVRLGIDFLVFDFQDAYKRSVVDYLVDEYRAGRTPNPDVMCNQEVKFGLFLDAALEAGFDAIATGHYARSEGGVLKRAADGHKDQTYFLYRMTRRAVERTLFPLGGLDKAQVRQIAEERGLPSAARPDSQGICFVGEAGIREFLRMYVPLKPGDIVDAETGAVLGRHDGAIFFTIGQRKGLDIGGGPARYVVAKDMATNTVLVSADKSLLRQPEGLLRLDRCSWVSGEEPAPGAYLVRTRHTGPLIPARLEPAGDGRFSVSIEGTYERVAPGQSVVVYRDDACLGGGIAC